MICKNFKKYFIYLAADLQKNRLAFLAPLPLLLSLLLYNFFTKQSFTHFGVTGLWLLLIFFTILALLYGMQCFSGESDRCTLDFLLTKPLSPYLIIGVKYFSSLIIFLVWWWLAQQIIPIDLSPLPLAKGMSLDWILLIFLIVHAMSLFSGLLTKGLERVGAVFLLTIGIAWLAYQSWFAVFKLIDLGYYWEDIPPRLLFFLTNLLPVLLTIISLAIPLIGAIWHLKSRIKFWRFKPILYLSSIWGSLWIILFGLQYFFSPLLAPAPTAKAGDWHEKTGIVLANVLDQTYEFRMMRKPIPCQLTLSTPHHSARILYRGIGLNNPRISPNGEKIIFTEKDQLRLLNLTNHKLTNLGTGWLASWSQDNQTLIIAQSLGTKRLSRLVHLNLRSQRKTIIKEQLPLNSFIWDSKHEKVYLFNHKEISCLNLRTNSLEVLKPSPEINFDNFLIAPPTLVFDYEANALLMAQLFQQEIHLFRIDLITNAISLSELKTDFRLKSGAAILLSAGGMNLLCPRIDGGYIYASTYYSFGKKHHHETSEEQ